MRCFDYNRGVCRGVCGWCGFDRFSMSEAHSALALIEGREVTPEISRAIATDLEFEARIEKYHRWSEPVERQSRANNRIVLEVAQGVFDGKACVHKEGSVRKHTAVQGSDVDLMVTLSDWRAMADAQRLTLEQALRARPSGV